MLESTTRNGCHNTVESVLTKTAFWPVSSFSLALSLELNLLCVLQEDGVPAALYALALYPTVIRQCLW